MPELTDAELIEGCHEFVLQQQQQQPPAEPEQKWTGSLTITPDQVVAILQSNNEE
jgi:hypothetical protein